MMVYDIERLCVNEVANEIELGIIHLGLSGMEAEHKI